MRMLKYVLIMIEKLTKLLIEKKLVISTAESCTGGLLSSVLTDVSGSSAYTKLNFVTYANEAKHEVLGVSMETLEKYGAVSEECAREMAEGLMKRTGCDVALCTTGIAGPTGGTVEKPVGLCYISCKYQDKTYVKKVLLNPDIERCVMKRQFTEHAVNLAYDVLSGNNICNDFRVFLH